VKGVTALEVAGRPGQSLREVQDDDAAVRLVFLGFLLRSARGVAIERQLEARLLALAFAPFAFLLLALPNLLDDERR
jgi:hypothetical protein